MSQGDWAVDGYVLVRNAFPPSLTAAALDQVSTAIRRDPPTSHPGADAYLSADGLHIVRESQARESAVRRPEDLVSRVFNCHTTGPCMALSKSPIIVERVVGILGSEVDCFQSQCIFKNPGAIGQGWHQDSYYFPFDAEPQIGVWIALTDANIDNSCLWVLPASHHEPIHQHVPDGRKGVNAGYLEIVDHDFTAAIPIVMNQGDILFFHSFLMHKSNDNKCQSSRAALVLHYARSGTKVLSPAPALAQLTRWISVTT